MTPEAQLARLALSARPPDGPRDIMHLSLIDWAACAIAGASEPVSGILRRHVAGEGSGATLVGGGTAAASRAAFANGTTSHALDYDDTHFAHIGHPSVAVIPAALAIAEGIGATMEALTDAALIGAEASIRTGVWLGRGHYETGFHQTATAGAIGATVAACRLLKLSEAQTITALSLAATRASGLKSQFGTMGKPMNAGLAAETGVEAARLAASGMTSTELGLSGPQGFGPTHHGAADETGFQTMGDLWLMETVSHKFHACCHGLHAALDALESLRDKVDPAKLDAVVITTNPRWLNVCNIAEPRSRLEAKFSYRLTAAMTLSGLETGAITTYTDAICHDAGLISIRDKVRVETDETMPETAAQVTLLSGNNAIDARHELNAPMPFDIRRAKIETKARALLGEARAVAVIGAVRETSLRQFVGLIGQDVSS